MSGGKLPEGWVETPLEDTVEILDSMRIPVNNKERQERTEGKDFNKLYPYYGATGEVGKIDDFIFDEELIALGEDGVSFFDGQKSKAYMLYGKTWVNNHAHVLKAIQGLSHNKFLCYFLNQFDYHDYVNGGTRLKLTQANMRKIPVRFAPFFEQKIIAEKLDTLLAQVDSTKARLEQIPKILKRFRQGVLASAVSGKLTLAWRENNEVSESAKELLIRWTNSREQKFTKTQKNLLASKKIKKIKTFPTPTPADMVTGEELIIPINWEIVSVSQIADCLDSQRVPVKKEYRTTSEGIYPYFGANGEVDRVDNFIFDGDFVLVTEDETFYGRTKPIAYRFTGKCWVNNHVHILSAPTKAANDYLCYALMYYKIIPWLTGTTGRAKLTQGALNSLPIGLPPEEEINEIVRRVEQLFAYADTIEKQVNSALTRVNSLTQSILAKAFRGELTAQWRAENPALISGENSAAALLEKIKAERAASGGKKASRKKA
ncbi:restriction endonuclease subunit S [Atlantibacter hermannii]|uniref:restriction endonuclease subunit S n=1 Tax=Atlantibacter hermannii TaxID=565 RepID=UPI0028A5D3B1|nr:restriction endonuclease subunit S [Atlantibacter hermannii]